MMNALLQRLPTLFHRLLNELKRWIPFQPNVAKDTWDGVTPYVATMRSFDDEKVAYLERLVGLQARMNMGFFVAVLLLSLLALILAFNQTVKVLVLHESGSGNAYITTLTQPTPNTARIHADIARYVRARESYYPDSYDVNYRLVELLSNTQVSGQYTRQQSLTNKQSPVNVLGKNATRQVTIHSIYILDRVHPMSNNKATQQPALPHENLARVNFTVTTTENATGITTHQTKVAFISWRYLGLPENPTAALNNWDGFNVTRYSVQSSMR